MKWAEWVYFKNKWEDDPRLPDLRNQRTRGKVTPAAYKAGIQLSKQDLLTRMLQEGRITAKDVINPCPPADEKTHKPFIGTKVRIGKAVPAHGRAHKLTPWKHSSEVPGGLPGQGKR